MLDWNATTGFTLDKYRELILPINMFAYPIYIYIYIIVAIESYISVILFLHTPRFSLHKHIRTHFAWYSRSLYKSTRTSHTLVYIRSVHKIWNEHTIHIIRMKLLTTFRIIGKYAWPVTLYFCPHFHDIGCVRKVIYPPTCTIFLCSIDRHDATNQLHWRCLPSGNKILGEEHWISRVRYADCNNIDEDISSTSEFCHFCGSPYTEGHEIECVTKLPLIIQEQTMHNSWYHFTLSQLTLNGLNNILTKYKLVDAIRLNVTLFS